MNSPTLPELHDAVLSQVHLHWEEGTLDLVLRPVATSSDIIVRFDGLSQFHCPRLAPWGHSIYVNRVTEALNDSSTLRRLQIEMQSGDVLDIEYESHSITTAAPGSGADAVNDPAGR